MLVWCLLIHLLWCQGIIDNSPDVIGGNPSSTEFYKLDLNNPRFTFQENIDDDYLWMDYGFEYGVWTQYTPLSAIKSIGTIPPSITNCSLIHYVSQVQEQLIYYVCMDYDILQIKHTVQLISQNNNLYQQSLILEQNFIYEGTWIYFHLSAIPFNNQYRITIASSDFSENSYEKYNDQFPFQTGTLDFFFGNSKEIQNSRFSIGKLSSFRGQIVLYLMQSYQWSYFLHFNKVDVRNFIQNSESKSPFVIDCIDLLQPQDIKLSSPQTIIPEYSITINTYQVKGWFKLQGQLVIGQYYEIIKVSPTLQLVGYEQLLKTVISTISYIKPNDQEFQIYIQTYSFQIPIINLNPDELSLGYFLQVDTFMEWHYLSIYYQTNYIIFQFYSGSSNKKYEKQIDVNQFSHYDIKVTIGQSLSTSNMLLHVEKLEIYQCLNEKPDLVCSTTCKTCSGPTQFHCLSCNENQNRVLIESIHQCPCQFGAWEYNDNCQLLSKFNYEIINLTDKPKEVEILQCSFGYIKFDQRCIRCPEIMNQYVQSCFDCSYKGSKWISKPACINLLISDSPISSYIKKGYSISPNVYLYWFEEFILCEFCESISFVNYMNYDSDYYHMNELVYPLCQSDFIYFNKKCSSKSQQYFEYYFSSFSCGENCQYCYYKEKCLSCIDPIKYYISVFQPSKCIPCLIQNCKYCFDYSIMDFTLNSYFQSTFNVNYDDVVAGCALCHKTYTYNFQTRECELIQQLALCEQQVIDQNNQLSCILSQQLNQAFGLFKCQNYIENCLSCIIDNDIVTCIMCDSGYEYNIEYNQCLKCLSENFVKCSYLVQTQEQNLFFISELQAMLYFMTQNLLSLQYYYPSEYPIECKVGYYKIETNCVKQCSDLCNECSIDQFTNSVICKTCLPSQFGTPIKGYQEQIFQETEQIGCGICPYDCLQCFPSSGLFETLNPYYTTSTFTESKCVIPIDGKQIDHNYGRVKQGKWTLAYINNFLSSNNFTSPFYKIVTGLLSNDTSEYSLLDIQSVDHVIYKNIIIEDLYGYYPNFNITLYDNYKIGILTVVDTSFTLVGQQLYKLSQFFYQFQTLYVNYIEFRNLIFPIFDENICHQYSNQQMNLKYESVLFSGNGIRTQFSFQFQYLESLNLTNVTFQNINLSQQVIFQQNITQEQSSLNTVLYFDKLSFINSTIEDSTIISLATISQKTNIIINVITFSNCYFTNANFLDYSEFTNKNPVFIDKLIIQNCTFNYVNLFKFSPTSILTISNFIILDSIISNTILIQISNTINITDLQIDRTFFMSSQVIMLQSAQLTNTLELLFVNFHISDVIINNTLLLNLPVKQTQNISISFINFTHHNLQDVSSYRTAFYNLQKSSDFENKFYSSIRIDNFIFQSRQSNIFKHLTFWSECFTENGLSSLIYISQFQDISISNLLISNQIFVDQIAIDINIDQNSKLDKITLTNLTFQQNLLINRQGGQQLYFIKIYIAKSMPLFINKLSFFQNVAHYYLKDISNLDSSFVSVSSYLSSIQMQEISIVDNYISNKSSSFFSIDCQEITINQLTMFNNNLKMVDFFVQDPTEELSQDIVELFIRQQFSVITKAYFGIISASTFLLNNSSFQNGYSFENNLFKMIGKEDCVLTMNNITIQNHSSFIKGKNILTSSTKTVQLIAGSIFIDSSASNLYLTLTNIKLSGIFNKLQSAFLYISPSQTINIVKIQNVLVENVFSLRNGLFFMDLDSSYSQTNSLTIENVEIANSQYEFEQYLSSLKLIEEVDLNQIYSQNGFIFISNSLVSIKKLHFSGYSISNILEIVNSKSVQLEQLEMHNIVTLSSLIVIQQSNVTIIHSRIQNIQLYDVSQLIYNSTSYNQSQFDLSSQNQCKLILRQNPKLLYDQLVQQVSHNLIISLIFRQIQSLINVELNMSTLQLYDAIYNQINSTNSIYGLVSISTYKQAKIILNQVDIVQGYYNNTGHLYIQGDCNQDVSISNSHFSKSQCLQGCAVNIDCGSLQIVNTVFEKNEAKLSGGAVKYDGKSLILKYVAFYDNFAQLGSALDIINMRLDDYSQITLNNNSNIQISEIPLSLFCQYNGQRLKSVTQIKENMRIASPTYSEVQQRLVIEANQNQYQEYLKLPSNIPLNQYKTFDEATQQYSPQNFSLQFLPLNKLEEIQRNLTTSSCTLKSNILNKNSNTILTGGSIETIYFDNSSNSYQISSVTFDPYSPEEQVLQIEIQCSLIENYVYQFNVRTYFCQMGEYYSNQGCYPCDSEKGYYSVKSNSSKCSQIDVNKIEKNTENLLKLKPGYWRTYITSEKIEKCKYDYCNGGWEVGTKSCKAGYIGALCEECDTYNQYTKASDSQCLPCKDSWQTIVSLLLMSLWTLFSIQITVKSIQEANEQYKSLMRRSKFYGIFHKYNQDVAGCLIKMLTNQVLIISAVYSFQQGLSVDFTWLGAISSPSLTNAFNFDCWLSLQNIIDILYLRLFLILALPFLYISIFIWLYLLYVISKGQKYDSSTLYIAIIYIFIITQPDIIKYCGSLLASRTISGVQWIQANLSYEYNTGNHENWLKFCVVPILLLWCVLFPVYFGTTIFINRKRLGFTVVRRKFSYLYTEYNLKCYYWEIVKIIQRELQVLVLTVFKEEIEIYVCLLFLIQFIYLKIITQIKPYNMNMLNHLEINSVQKCILILIIGLITFITVKQEMISFSIIAQILLIIITLLHLMPFIYDLMLVYIEKYQEKLQELVKLRPWIARFLPKYFENLKRKEIVRKKYQKIKVHLMNRVSSLKKFNELQIQ